MSDLEFNLTPYISAPIFTLEGGIALCRALLGALPKGMPAAVKQGAQKLDTVADKAQAALARRQREAAPSTEEDRRALDIEGDQAWSALRQRLDAYATLPEASFPKAARARALQGLVFSEGTGFLTYSYPEQFVTMDTLLKRIDEEHLAKDLDDLCGPEFLQQIRRVHPRYAAMVQRRMVEAPASENLSQHVRTLQRTIVEYATRVGASVDSDDAQTVSRAYAALRPIDSHREQQARRASGSPAPTPPAPEPSPAPTP